jgi:pimeloyl-ACP methyl ester carboxylesterase
MHILESGETHSNAKLIVLLHGFPELAYSWRKVLPVLASKGYHVVAPDQRGFGQTTGWSADYSGPLAPFRMTSLAADVQALVAALGYQQAHCVVGHDFGSPVAAWTILLHPGLSRGLCLMSAPFGGPPSVLGTSVLGVRLGDLQPPRKHYQAYFSTPEANAQMSNSAQGLAQFLREYYHVKSADWSGNHGSGRPHPLEAASAEQLALLPRYYVMDEALTMPETVSQLMGSRQAMPIPNWLNEEDLAVYVTEFSRTGFQGGLNWYRCASDADSVSELRQYAGRQIAIPSMFIAGEYDWGVVQKPGELARMQEQLCTNWRKAVLVANAGHWVQQEQAVQVASHLIEFCATLG